MLGERYEIVREIGRGGMGVVYACVDRATGERVAVKRVDRPGRGSQGDTFWFHQEARALASLDHPAIVRARDFGVLADGSPYLVMELIDGRSLQSVLEQGPPSWPFTWAVIDQVLSALSHAHARGVVHGDIKPQNILVGIADGTEGIGQLSPGDPRVQVLDFGLAFLLRDRQDPRLDGQSKTAVAMPTGGGTPGFMAPEQIRRAVPHVGPPTDLYAIGCILFQMLDGSPPFIAMKDGPDGRPAVDEDMLLKLHKSAAIPRPDLPPGVPDEVADLVVRLLAKRPWRRFDYAADVRRRWEALRPMGSYDTELDVEMDVQLLPRSTAPDTRVDALTHGPIASAPLRAPQGGAPELLGLRPIPMIGRGHERMELAHLVDMVAASSETDEHAARQRVAVILGEAGVGKSRVVEWLCERVHEGGRMVPLRARYRRINGPLDGLNGAVLAHYGLERVDRILVEQALINTWEIDKDDDEGMTWVAATAEWLRPSAASVAPKASASEDRRTRERATVGPTGKRFSLDEPELRWLVIRRVLERIGRDRPILLFLDDMHLAPPGTFDGLAKLRRELPRVRMLLVCTARTEALVADPAIDRRLEALRRAFGGPRFRLGPFDAADTQTLLRSALPLDDRALHEAQERSRGNPLFALQLLHSWAATGGLELAGGVYRVRDAALAVRATTTAELWDDRLSALPDAHRASAEAASALGMEFRGDVLRRLVGHVVGLAGFGLEVTRALDALQRGNILVGSGEDRFRFPHALLQEHLLHRLARRSDARALFRAAADALAQHPLAGTRRIVRHRALNYLRAGDADDAAALLLGYVEESWSRVRDASRTLEDLAMLDTRKLDVAASRPASPDDTVKFDRRARNPPKMSPPFSALHQRWRAEALRHAGRFEEAREAAQKARKIFIADGNERQEAHCMRLLGHIGTEQGTAVEGRKLVARALTIFDRLDDDRGRASCEVVLGEIDYLLGDYASARDALHRGARRFRGVGDALGRAQSLLLLGMIELAEGVLPKARDLLGEARGEFDAIGYRLGLSQCDVAIAHVEHRAGDFDSARRRAEQTRNALRALENPRGLAGAERLLAMLAIDRDDPGNAVYHARAALDLFEKLGDPWGVLEARLLLAQEALLRGALDEASDELAACDGIETGEAEPQQHRALTKAWLEAARQHPRKAAAHLEEAQKVFHDPRRMGDHAAMLLARFDTLGWKDPAGALVRGWHDQIGGLRASGAWVATPAARPIDETGP
jgi:serine/threonine protein kinase/tetratricopeptide (TPR) repeat protein